MIEGVRKANKTFSYNAKLIGILSRSYGVDNCYKELNAILNAKKHNAEIVAIDLAGDEQAYPARDFIDHFKCAKDSGLEVTIHAGEVAGPNSIWDAIKILGATRIGHGVSAFKDVSLLEYMAENQIGIETCLLSNYQTGSWTNIENHPLKIFLDYNIPVFLNTDDPGVSANTLRSEYELAKQRLLLNDSQINQLKVECLGPSVFG